MTALKALDDKDYRDITRNFRNSSSHDFAPRFELGITGMIKRVIVSDTVMAERRDGRFEAVPHPIRKAVSYEVGGTPPLALSAMFEANLQQHDRAVAALNAHQDLIAEILPCLQDATP